MGINRYFSYVLILLLFSTSLISSNGIISEDIKQIEQIILDHTIYVDGANSNGPWDGSIDRPYQFIKDGVHHADEEDVIYIFQGIYHENILISKQITLIGQQKNTTIIDGDYHSSILHLQSDHITISDITLQNSGGNIHDSGILLESSNNTIVNCQFYRTKNGIYISNQTNNSIKNHHFQTNGAGISLVNSRDTTITNCSFFHNGIGIQIIDSTNTSIAGCLAHTNGIGYYIEKSSEMSITKSAAYNNNDNQGGFFLESCNSISFDNCIISHNGFGLKSSFCQNISIKHSTISYNTHAGFLIMDQSQNISIKHCNISKNLRISIYNSQSQISFQKNNIYNSICGVYSERAICDAEKNWWGSQFGPGFIERNQQDNIKQKKSQVDFIPWEFNKIEQNGASWKAPLFDNIPYNDRSIDRYSSISGKDTDGDGAADLWETKYGYNPSVFDNHLNLDPDNDGLSNVEECYTDQYGSHPFQKDIFLEFDWIESQSNSTESNKPSEEYIKKAVEIFKENNISLHIDVGNLDGGEQIPYTSNFSFADLKDFYWDYFLHNDINNPRKGIFHYGLICDYGPSSGFSFIGCDALDSFCISADILKNQFEIPYPRQRFIIGASIHELGHTLGLTVDDHGGNDNKIATLPFTIQWFKYLNYRSCMNYFYTYLILGFSDGSHGPGDFDDWGHMDFSFFKNTHFILPEQYR